MFGDLKDVNLFTQKFYMLDRVDEDVSRYRNIILVDVSAFGHSGFIFKKHMRMTTLPKECTFEETV